jgi:hypothetical protein
MSWYILEKIINKIEIIKFYRNYKTTNKNIKIGSYKTNKKLEI